MIEVDAGFCRECGGMACWEGEQVRCVICNLAREPTESEAERHRAFSDHAAHRDLLATTERELVEAARRVVNGERCPWPLLECNDYCGEAALARCLAAYDRARVKED